METGQVFILTVIFLATFTRSTFGFGDALVAMPLLTLAISLEEAAPLVALTAVTISTTILIKQWRRVQLKSAGMLIIFALGGIPLGIYLLKGIHDTVMKMILAAVIITFSLYQIFHPRLRLRDSDKYAPLFGLLAGILGGAYNINGLPAAIYGTLRGWEAPRFRATMQGFFFPTGLMIALGHGVGGFWTRPVLGNFLLCVPGILVAVYFGGILNGKIPPGKFDRYVYLFLVIIGIVLLINTSRPFLS
ncbi:MAG: hypothetical protein AMJ79_13225 [Phycisphaerae bacterium SM23_30]|nr:MAG: hypothetical protein AMJ79_13225 [Phycisphaerae bacterium SM23_30]